MRINLFDIIIKPVLTNKAVLREKNSPCYTFAVHLCSTKTEIIKAIHEIFHDVKVKDISTFVRKGKVRSYKGKSYVTAAKKFAIVKTDNLINLRGVNND